REDSWVAYVLFLRNRKQLLRSVYVHVVFWKFLIFGRGKKCKNASDEIIWRTPCSTSADPLGVADPRLKTSVLSTMVYLQMFNQIACVKQSTFLSAPPHRSSADLTDYNLQLLA